MWIRACGRERRSGASLDRRLAVQLFVKEVCNNAALQGTRRDEFKTVRESVMVQHACGERDGIAESFEKKFDGHHTAQGEIVRNERAESAFAHHVASTLYHTLCVFFSVAHLHGARTAVPRESADILVGRRTRGGRKRKHSSSSYCR